MSSLRPELEFELLKLVLLREQYIQRLKNKLDTDNNKDACSKRKANNEKTRTIPPNKAKVDMGLIGMFEYIRDCSVQVVEKIHTWERTQLNYPEVVTYKWNGQNYLEKMSTDLEFLEDYPYVIQWAGFSTINNPFLVPPEVFLDDLSIPRNAIMEFGGAPQPENAPITQNKAQGPFTKSPYLTPIINDPQVFTHLSARSKLNAKFSTVRSASAGGEEQRDEYNDDGTATGNNTYRSTGTRVSGAKVAVRQSAAKSDVNPYKSYVNSEMIHKLRTCWKILRKLDVTGRNTAVNRSSGKLTAGATGSEDAEGLFGDSIQAGGATFTASQLQHYDESKIFNNSFAESHDPSAPTDHGPATQRSAGEFKGLYGTSTQSFGPQSQLLSPSQVQQASFQNNKEYFQQALHATSGAEYGAQDAQNAMLRMFPVLPQPPNAASAIISNADYSRGSPAKSYRSAVEDTYNVNQSGVPVAAEEGGLAEDSAGTWGTASEPGATFRVRGVQGAHPNPGVFNDTGAAGTLAHGMQLPSATLGGASGTQLGGSVEIGHGLATTSSQLWTPHEIHLQTQVQRRGGELFVLTAAGTQGRMKTPWRRTRFERLEEDVRLLHEQSAMMHMAVEEAVTRAVLSAENLASSQLNQLASASGEEKASETQSRRVSFQSHSPIYSGPTTARPPTPTGIGKRPRSAGVVLPIGRTPPVLSAPVVVSNVTAMNPESLAPPSATPFTSSRTTSPVPPTPKTEFTPLPLHTGTSTSMSSPPPSRMVRPVTPPALAVTTAQLSASGNRSGEISTPPSLLVSRPGSGVDEARLQALRQRAQETRAREDASVGSDEGDAEEEVDEGAEEVTDAEVSDGDDSQHQNQHQQAATSEAKPADEGSSAGGVDGKEVATQTDSPDSVAQETPKQVRIVFVFFAVPYFIPFVV